MDTTTSVMATGVVVTLGRWSEDKSLTMKIFVGFGVMTAALAVMQSGNQKFAEQFAALILVAAVFFYAIPISRKLGFSSKNTITQMR